MSRARSGAENASAVASVATATTMPMRVDGFMKMSLARGSGAEWAHSRKPAAGSIGGERDEKGRFAAPGVTGRAGAAGDGWRGTGRDGKAGPARAGVRSAMGRAAWWERGWEVG